MSYRSRSPHAARKPLFCALIGVVGALGLAPHLATAQERAPHESPAEAVSGTVDDRARAHPMTLDEALAFADKKAPDLLDARARRSLADASEAEAQRVMPFNPELEVAPRLGVGESARAGVEITLTQRLELAAARRARGRVASRHRLALGAGLKHTRARLHQAVRGHFRQALIAARRLDAARTAAEFSARLSELVQTRFEAGASPRTSVLLASAQAAGARDNLIQARRRYDHHTDMLATAIGWDRDVPLSPSGEVLMLHPLPSVDELLASAAAANPDLVHLDAQIDLARAKTSLEARERFPNPLVGLSYDHEGGLKSSAGAVRLIIGAPLPLWSRNQVGRAQANAELVVLEQARRSQRTRLASRLRAARSALRSAAQRVQLYRDDILPALQTQLDLLQRGFELGELSLLDVLGARDRLLAVKDKSLDALAEYATALNQIEALVGAPAALMRQEVQDDR